MGLLCSRATGQSCFPCWMHQSILPYCIIIPIYFLYTHFIYRPVLIRDLDCQVILNFFDEANVADWKGRDLRQANRIPNIDVLLLVIRKVCWRKFFIKLTLSVFVCGRCLKWRPYTIWIYVCILYIQGHPWQSVLFKLKILDRQK